MAAGAGLTAAVDLSLTNTILGAASGTYTAPTSGAMYMGCSSTQFTAASKAGQTEWTTGSDPAYVRVALGTAGTRTTGWTIAAYSSGVGVVFNNFAQVTQPAVTSNAQTLYALFFADSITVGGGNIDLFSDFGASQGVNVGIQVILLATTGVAFTTY